MACLVGGREPAWTTLLAADGLPSYAGALTWWPGGRRPWCPLQGRAHAGAAAAAPLVLFFSRFLLRMRMREREREREREGRGRGRPGGVGRVRGEKSGIPRRRIVAIEFG